jgi:hypothetical protein
VIVMKMFVISLLLAVVAVTGARASTTPFSPAPPAVDAQALLRYLRVARDYNTCIVKCADRYNACMAGATTDSARRSCQLDRSLCEGDCSRFGAR